jgi:hypothetical protein
MPKSKYIKATPHGNSGVLYETEDGEKYLQTGGTRDRVKMVLSFVRN